MASRFFFFQTGSVANDKQKMFFLYMYKINTDEIYEMIFFFSPKFIIIKTEIIIIKMNFFISKIIYDSEFVS